MISSEPKEQKGFWLNVVTLLITVAALVVAVWQIHQSTEAIELARKATQVQNEIALNSMFFHDSTNVGIIEAMGSHKAVHIVNGGDFNDTQISNYLGDFHTIYNSYQYSLFTEDQLCVSFSYFIELTKSNTEVSKYAEQNGQSIVLNLLHEIVIKSSNPNCKYPVLRSN